MTRRPRLPLVALSMLLFLGCGGGGKNAATGPLDAGTLTGEGIVKSGEGSAAPEAGLPEGVGGVRFDVSHTDRLINKNVEIELLDAAGKRVGKVAGNELLELPPGTYSAEFEYDETEEAKDYVGKLNGLVVHAGNVSTYRVSVEAPVGLLRLKFSDGEENLSPSVTLTIYRAEDDPELVVGPVWQGPAGDSVLLPEGAYQVRAVYAPENGSPITEWYRDLTVGAAMARTERDIVLELDLTGLRVDAFNFGRDVNNRTRVYLYAEGADIQFAVAKFQGAAGEAIPADPGVYDVRVVYTPSATALNFLGDKLLPGIKVNPGLGTRIQSDVELPMAMLRVKVMDGTEDVSDKTEIRVMRTGADKDAASPLVDELGVGQHPIPVGRADVTLYAPKADGTRRMETFRGVEVENGWAWEQTFDLKSAVWTPVAARQPSAPLRPITWTPPGDDDDSAGDDDDSAKPAGATPPPAAPAPKE